MRYLLAFIVAAAASPVFAVDFDPKKFPQICVGSLTSKQEQLPFTAIDKKLQIAMQVDEFLKIWFAQNDQSPPNAFVRLTTVNKALEMIERDFNVLQIAQINETCLKWLQENK